MLCYAGNTLFGAHNLRLRLQEPFTHGVVTGLFAGHMDVVVVTAARLDLP
jgi:hypothetical protein